MLTFICSSSQGSTVFLENYHWLLPLPTKCARVICRYWGWVILATKDKSLNLFSVPFLHQGELEKLNQSTDDINRRETELEVRKAGSLFSVKWRLSRWHQAGSFCFNSWRVVAGIPSSKLSNSLLPDRINYTTEASLWVERVRIQFHVVFIMEAPRGPNQGHHTRLSPKVNVSVEELKGLRGKVAVLFNGQEWMSSQNLLNILGQLLTLVLGNIVCFLRKT